MRRSLFLLLLLLALPLHAAQTVVSLDNLLPQPNTFLNSSSAVVEAATFLNTTYESWGSLYWAGFALSTVSNTTANSFTNQYAAAQSLPRAYAVGYHDYYQQIAPEITLDLPAAPKSILVNNTTYTALTIRNGDEYGFSQPFSNGNTFFLTLTARDLEGHILATTNHYLADFRDGKTFIQTNWTTLDLSWMPPDVTSLVGTLTTSDVGAYGPNTPMYLAFSDFTYAYDDSSRGIAATNSAILCWADGWSSYVPGTNVDAKWQTPANALGAAVGTLDGLGATNGIVCLGDEGQITLTFPVPITDGPGADFAVFENAFADTFLELATVDVSSDGTNFVRFPSHCLETNWIDTYTATNASDPTAYAGLAGKHTQGFGTPFDLCILAGEPSIDIRRITHVKITDVLGNGTHLDSYGNPIYDPTPTWGSGGFDLDAIGVLHARIEISDDPTLPPPSIPGYTTIKEYTPTLDPPAWTNTLPETNTPGFFRYRLMK